MDKDIALAIQEYNKKTRDLYIWKERRGAFEAARKLYKEHLQSVKQIDDSVDVNALMEEWDRNNTRTVIKPEFYVKRKQILERINRISSKIKEKADQKAVNEFSETWNKIFDQLTGYRDKDGQPIGTNLSEEKIKKVKDLLEDIEKTKAMESQIIGRVVRLGQQKSTKILRFVTKGTVEEEHFNRNRYDLNILQE